jgi:hypothetical protein
LGGDGQDSFLLQFFDRWRVGSVLTYVLIVTPLEEIGFGHRQTSEEDSGLGQSTIIDMRHTFFATQPCERLVVEGEAQEGDV